MTDSSPPMNSASAPGIAAAGARPPRTAPAWLPALALVLSTVAVTAVAAEPRREDRIAAIFPPWWDAATAAAAAATAGDLSAAGGWDNVLIVHSDTPGLRHRLRAAGAILLIDADLARACADTTSQGSRP